MTCSCCSWLQDFKVRFRCDGNFVILMIDGKSRAQLVADLHLVYRSNKKLVIPSETSKTWGRIPIFGELYIASLEGKPEENVLLLLPKHTRE